MSLTHYLSLKAIPQLELPHSSVMAYGLQFLHRILPLVAGQVGLGFPQYQQHLGLGHTIRLFGSQMDLDLLWLQLQTGKLKNYFLIGAIESVPEQHTYVRYQRVQHKGQSALRRAEKRLHARGEWTADIGEKMVQKQQTVKRYPHVFLKSYSTQQPKFLLEIRQIKCEKAQSGEFNGYGLSRTATVPHF